VERTRRRCSSMSSLIVIAFRTHGIHRSCHIRLENGGELPKILGGLSASVHWKNGGVDGRTREARIKAGRSRRTATNMTELNGFLSDVNHA
jgi:hypothetical protein